MRWQQKWALIVLLVLLAILLIWGAINIYH